MKKLIVLIAFLFPVLLFGQSKLDFSSSLNYSYRDFIKQSPIISSEKGKLNYHFGANYSQKLNEKLWLKIGVGFASMGYNSKKGNNLMFGSQHDGEGNFDPTLPGGISSIQFKYNFQFLEIPIALRYEFPKKKWTPYFEFGLSTMYYLQSSYQTFIEDKKSDTTNFRDKDLHQIQFATIFSFGLSYAFNEKWELLLQPNFRYHLSKMVDTSNEHLWSGGLAIGVRRKLK